MGRALRRTLSGHFQHEHSNNSNSSSSSIGRGTMSSGFVGPNGGLGAGLGGEDVCGVAHSTPRLFHTQQQQGSHVSSLTSLSSGSGGPGGVLGFSSTRSSLFRACYCSDVPYNLSKLFLIFPFSWFRIVPRSGSMDKPVKSKGTLYRSPLVQLLMSFVLGFMLGCAPLSWFGPSGARDDARQDLALEVNGFVTNLPREGSQSGQKLLEIDSGVGAVGLEHEGGGRLNSEDDTTDGSSDSRVDVSGDSFLEIAPGLSYTFDSERKLIIVITPTFNRPFQAHYLTRLAHTLRLVPPPLLWLVVEYPWASYETATFLRQTGIMYRHLVCHDNITNFRNRGIHQRNRALKHIEMHQLDGVVYFADDDNIYSLELFEQLRKIKRFGTWPVGILAENRAKAIIEGPVCDGEKVIGWQTNEKSKKLRRFHVDMSGFGFNSRMLWDRTTWRHRSEAPIRQLTNKEGLQETTFIEQLVEDESQMEGLPSGCRKIMVWHLHLDKADLYYPAGWTLSAPLEANTPLRP